MEAHKITLTKGAAGMCGVILSSLDTITKGFVFYGGAIVVILTVTSLGFDIYRKWKHRKD